MTISQTDSAKPRFFYGYLIVATGFLIMLIGTGIVSSYGVFFKPLLGEFGWTRAMVSGAYSLSLFLRGLLGIVAGRLTDRLGARAVVTASGLILGVGVLLLSQTSAIWQLYLFFGVIIGIGQSCIYAPIMSTASRWFDRKKGLMVGLVTAGVGGGQIIISPLASRLITSYGWRQSYVILGIATLVIIVAAAQFLKRSPDETGHTPPEKRLAQQGSSPAEAKESSLYEALHTRELWMLFFIYFSIGLIGHSTALHIVPHATDLGISTVSAAAILATFGGLNTAGRIVMGNTIDKVGNRISLSIILILITASLFWAPFARELWMLHTFAAVLGFANGGSVSLQSTITAKSFGMRAHGAMLGVILFSVSLGGVVGSYLAGHMFDILGNYQLVFLIFAILGLISLILARLLRSVT